MALPNSYTTKPGSIDAYFEAMLNAEAPERFSTRFLESLEFKSTNDRNFIGILKELDFIDADGVPKDRYYEFLDRSKAEAVVAEAVREAFSDLFAVNKSAEKLSAEDVRNKLRTLYKGAKKDNVLQRIASTFVALCEYADFSTTPTPKTQKTTDKDAEKQPEKASERGTTKQEGSSDKTVTLPESSLSLDSLQYHINIVLPPTRDQAVYDAIFKSLRDHLGVKK